MLLRSSQNTAVFKKYHFQQIYLREKQLSPDADRNPGLAGPMVLENYYKKNM